MKLFEDDIIFSSNATSVIVAERDDPRDLDGDLGRNWFVSDTTHATAALKVMGLRNYGTLAHQLAESLRMVDAATPGLSEVSSAAGAYSRFKASADDAASLLVTADGQVAVAMRTRSVPNTPPTGNIDIESWRAAWYIDNDQVRLLLVLIEPLYQAADRAITDLMNASKREQGKPPIHAPAPQQIDWNDPPITKTTVDLAKRTAHVGQEAVKAGAGMVGGVVDWATKLTGQGLGNVLKPIVWPIVGLGAVAGLGVLIYVAHRKGKL